MVTPVSYTHLDVYKRQSKFFIVPTSTSLPWFLFIKHQTLIAVQSFLLLTTREPPIFTIQNVLKFSDNFDSLEFLLKYEISTLHLE